MIGDFSPGESVFFELRPGEPGTELAEPFIFFGQ